MAEERIIENRIKEKSKFQRWLYAVKNPSQKAILANQLSWSFGMTLGLFGAFATLLWSRQWIWSFIVFCGSMMNVWQVIALNQALRNYMIQEQAIKAIQANPDKVWEEIEKANKESIEELK